MSQRVLRLVSVGWIVALILGVLGVSYHLLALQWYESRPLHSHTAPSMPILSWCLDYLFAIWLSLPGLGFVVLVFTAAVSWRASYLLRKDPTRHGKSRWLISSALVASVGSLALLANMLPSAVSAAAGSGLCETTTFKTSPSPNGRYRASVIRVDCGAWTSVNRQVTITRVPFTWASESVMYFNGEPSVGLSWAGRMLTIRGEKATQSMNHPPPDPMVWGGIMMRYIGPEQPN